MSFEERTRTILLGACLAVELLDHGVHSIFSFSIFPKTFSKFDILPPAVYQGLAHPTPVLTHGGSCPAPFVILVAVWRWLIMV